MQIISYCSSCNDHPLTAPIQQTYSGSTKMSYCSRFNTPYITFFSRKVHAHAHTHNTFGFDDPSLLMQSTHSAAQAECSSPQASRSSAIRVRAIASSPYHHVPVNSGLSTAMHQSRATGNDWATLSEPHTVYILGLGLGQR